MLASIVVAVLAPVEVAPWMAHHDWLAQFHVRLKPLTTCPFRLAANNAYHRPHHRRARSRDSYRIAKLNVHGPKWIQAYSDFSSYSYSSMIDMMSSFLI